MLDKAYAALTLTSQHQDWRTLSQSAELPRLSKSLGTAGALVNTFNTCTKPANTSDKAAIACTLKATLPSDQIKIVTCFEKNGKTPKALECIADLSPATKAVIACQGKNSGDSASAAKCALETQLPEEAKRALYCQLKYPQGGKMLTACIAAEVLGSDVGKMAVCINKQQGQVNSDAVACALDGRVPKEAQVVIGCIQGKNQTAAQIAGCVAGQSLPGDWGRAAQCIAESQGDPLGAGVCMASDGMNAESRIALQCAASTGGDPFSFAACAGGNLARKELIQCRGKKFGEPPCFGENNEFRKLGRTLCGPGCDIGSDSLVGQAANVGLDILKFRVAFQEALLKEGTKLVENISKEVDRGAQNVAHELEKAGQNLARETGNAIQGAARAAEQLVNNPGRSVESFAKQVLCGFC